MVEHRRFFLEVAPSNSCLSGGRATKLSPRLYSNQRWTNHFSLNNNLRLKRPLYLFVKDRHVPKQIRNRWLGPCRPPNSRPPNSSPPDERVDPQSAQFQIRNRWLGSCRPPDSRPPVSRPPDAVLQDMQPSAGSLNRRSPDTVLQWMRRETWQTQTLNR